MKLFDADTRYLLLALVIIVSDRVSKWCALTHWSEPKQVTDFLSFELIFNRGVSWGLLHSHGTVLFYLVTGVVLMITGAFLVYTIIKRLNQQPIYSEVLVLAGSVSNLVDRFVYDGVIDFIHLYYGIYSWPVFNVADMAIVLGIGLIMYEQWNA